MSRGGPTIVYLGPSLPAAEARALLPTAELRPPVAVGDVLRAAAARTPPARIAIIDGYFERMAAVWHKEILRALEVGIEVWGAASMGALRAAELERFGMRGVGAIYADFRRGRLSADAEVAVAHLPDTHGYRPVSVALASVRDAVRRARRGQALTAADAALIVARAEATFYWERTWDDLALAVPAPARARFVAWLDRVRPDRKADDARALLRTLATTPIRRRRAAAVPRTWALDQLARQLRLPSR